MIQILPVVADGIDEAEEEAVPMNRIEKQLPTAASKIAVPFDKKLNVKKVANNSK